MRNRSIGLVFVSVFLWGVITYFLFLDRPIGKEQPKNQFANQINDLGKDIKQLFLSNKQFLKELEEKSPRKKPVKEVAENFLVDDIYQEKNDPNVEGGQRENVPKESDTNEVDPRMQELHKLASRKTLPDGSPVIAVLVFSCNRVTVQRCLDQLTRLRPRPEQFPIIVSQDCEHPQTAEVIKSYGNQVFHIQQPDQNDIDIPPKEKKFKGYFKIARHYGWALNQVFLNFGFNTAIAVEDDLDISPDFYEYFLGTYPILVSDPSLWCVSAWNDNGKPGLIDDAAAEALYRTDFFPGLGWMLTRSLWQELSPKWPKAYWDDWIRKPEQRKKRACIRPELSRTRTFGKNGVSNGLFFEKHLKFIKLNDQYVPFTKMNLSYLLKDNYDIAFVREVYQSKVVSYSELKSGNIISSGPVRIPYYTRQSFKSTAKMLGLMDDFRSGVPRTGYRGVVTLFYNGRRVHLAPSASWSGYDIKWS